MTVNAGRVTGTAVAALWLGGVSAAVAEARRVTRYDPVSVFQWMTRPTALELAVSAPTREQISLAAGERRVLQLALPPGGGPVDLGLDVRSGFPAAAVGPASDSRLLGACLTFRPAVR